MFCWVVDCECLWSQQSWFKSYLYIFQFFIKFGEHNCNHILKKTSIMFVRRNSTQQQTLYFILDKNPKNIQTKKETDPLFIAGVLFQLTWVVLLLRCLRFFLSYQAQIVPSKQYSVPTPLARPLQGRRPPVSSGHGRRRAPSSSKHTSRRHSFMALKAFQSVLRVTTRQNAPPCGARAPHKVLIAGRCGQPASEAGSPFPLPVASRLNNLAINSYSQLFSKLHVASHGLGPRVQFN